MQEKKETSQDFGNSMFSPGRDCEADRARIPRGAGKDLLFFRGRNGVRPRILVTRQHQSLLFPPHSSVSLADDGSECVIRSNIAGCVYISPSLSLDLAVWKVSAAELQANFGPLGPADRLPADLNPT